MYFLAASLSLLIGLSLGLLGGGGSILTLPILVYALGMEEKTAIAASLLVVGITSATVVVTHARVGNVEWRTGLIFAAAGMVGAALGGFAAAWIPAQVLLIAFAGMMFATSVAMIRGRRAPAAASAVAGPLPVPKVLLYGLLVGALTGTVGAGGGFLVVPALALLGGLPMRKAIGTSLLVITLNSTAGFLGHATHVQIDWPITLTVAASAVVGAQIGGRLSGRIDQETLRKAFGWFVLLMAFYMIWKQVF